MLLSITFVGVLKSLILIIFFLVALLLMLVVLLQEPKGGGLAAAFGGAGAETFGVQSGSVNKFTTYVAGIFLALAIAYAMLRTDGDTQSSPTDLTRTAQPIEDGGAGAGDAGAGEDAGSGDAKDKGD